MDPKCVLDLGERLCERCLAAGGYCAGCLRSLLPQIAVNRGWLKLIAAAKYLAAPLALTESPDPAVRRAERREQRKRDKQTLARHTRITKLISGQFHRAAPRRAALSPTP